MSKEEESKLHEDRRRLDWLERTDELAGKRALGPISAPDVTPDIKLSWVLNVYDGGHAGRTVRQAIDEVMRRWQEQEPG